MLATGALTCNTVLFLLPFVYVGEWERNITANMADSMASVRNFDAIQPVADPGSIQSLVADPKCGAPGEEWLEQSQSMTSANSAQDPV